METITDYMSEDHVRCDDLFAAAEDSAASGRWDAGQPILDGFLYAMERHFVAEEEILFPMFEEATGGTMGPTAMMRMEHRQMRELFSAMAQSFRLRDAESFRGEAETLLILMQQHNVKEENVLYPMADQMLEAERQEILTKMAAAG